MTMPAVYKFVVCEDDVLECDSCNYPAPVRTFDSHTEASDRNSGPTSTERRQLCEICASSPIGNHTAYPGLYPHYSITSVAGYCTNAILDQVGKFRDAPIMRVDSLDDLEVR